MANQNQTAAPQDYGTSILDVLKKLSNLSPGALALGPGMRALGAGSAQPSGSNPLPAMAAGALGIHEQVATTAAKKFLQPHADESVKTIGPQATIDAGKQLDQKNTNNTAPPAETQAAPQAPATPPATSPQQSLNPYPVQPMGGQGQQNPLAMIANLIKGVYPIAAIPDMMANAPTIQALRMNKAYGETPQGKLESAKAAAEQVPLTAAQEADLGKSRATMAYDVGKPMIEAAQAGQPLEDAFNSWKASKGDVGSQQAYLGEVAKVLGTTPKDLVSSLGVGDRASMAWSGKLSPAVMNGIHSQAQNLIKSKTNLANRYLQAVNDNLSRTYGPTKAGSGDSSQHPAVGQTFDGGTITSVKKIRD